MDGKQLKIDVLRDLVGLRRQELELDSDTFEVGFTGELFAVRVLPVLPLARAKVASLATLDQENRNDYRHVRLMLLVVREYLARMIHEIGKGTVGSREVLNRLEQTLKLVPSREAAVCTAKFALNFDAVWPRDQLECCDDERIRNFAHCRLPRSR